MLETLSKSSFSIKIEGPDVIRVLQEVKENIIEVTILDRRSGHTVGGYLIGLKGEGGIVVRAEERLDEKRKYELRFISKRGIVLLRSSILEKVGGVHPSMYVFDLPKSILVCERRKYYRMKPREKAEVIIKRESGYVLFGNLGDISLGGFSLNIQMRDRMFEYFLPMINEEVRFSIEIPARKLKIEGTAVLKHYTVDAGGFYRGGFSFSKVSTAELRKIMRILRRGKRA